MKSQPFFQRKSVWWIAAVCVLALAATLWFWPKKETDTLNVPLGVEQAAIVTYSGPAIAVAPYKWGVAVNVRIAEVVEHPGKRIYDLRYIVNRAGTFDLKDYLVADDGSRLDGLPTFKFTGDPKLSKNLDTRIQETEAIRVDVGGRYYETMAVLGALWIVWLLLLIFYKRPRPPGQPVPAPSGPTLAEMLRAFLTQLEAGHLGAAGKAKMEMLLLRCWRDELELGCVPMGAALEKIALSERTADSLRKLQHWLHHPASPVKNAEVIAVLTPYTIEAKPEEIAAAL